MTVQEKGQGFLVLVPFAQQSLDILAQLVDGFEGHGGPLKLYHVRVDGAAHYTNFPVDNRLAQCLLFAAWNRPRRDANGWPCGWTAVI